MFGGAKRRSTSSSTFSSSRSDRTIAVLFLFDGLDPTVALTEPLLCSQSHERASTTSIPGLLAALFRCIVGITQTFCTNCSREIGT